MWLIVLISMITAVNGSTDESIEGDNMPKLLRKSNRVVVFDTSSIAKNVLSSDDELLSQESSPLDDTDIDFGRYHDPKRKRRHGNVRHREEEINGSTKEKKVDEQQQTLRRTSANNRIHKKSNLDVDVELLEKVLTSRAKVKRIKEKLLHEKSNLNVEEDALKSLLSSSNNSRDSNDLSYTYTDIPTTHPTILLSAGPTSAPSAISPIATSTIRKNALLVWIYTMMR